MCGIAGAFAYRADAPSVDRTELVRMRDAMVARGPDGAGLWLADHGRVGFGHRRLAIIDLSEGGAQPMLDPESGNWICFNGEIYNHQQLRARSDGLIHSIEEMRYGNDLLAAYQPIGEAPWHWFERLSHGRNQLVGSAPECNPVKLLAIPDDQETERSFA